MQTDNINHLKSAANGAKIMVSALTAALESAPRMQRLLLAPLLTDAHAIVYRLALIIDASEE